MCGIAGMIGPGAADRDTLEEMAARIRHRGPDDHGVWFDVEAGVGLAHRRLSIVDLSPHGHQPMVSSDGRFVLCYNGEIYNHLELRRQLEQGGGAPTGGWRGHSDSETLIEAIANWGLGDTLSRVAGMFAFAVWDRQEWSLYLARDRFGEKPLYYGWSNGTFLFASELKAIEAFPAFDGAIDRQAVAQFTSLGCVPAPRSIFRGIFKLPPSTILSLTGDAALRGRTEPPQVGGSDSGLTLRRYWSFGDVVEQGVERPFATLGEATDAVEQALMRAIGGQLVADVPVGCFLSGGVDSSIVVALASKLSARPISTFTIGFDDPNFDESCYARQVAQHLGTNHHEAIVRAADAIEVIPALPEIYREPFADSSQIPTYLVSRFASSHVKVALTGDGGDELFSGYRRHISAPQLWHLLDRWPVAIRRPVAAMLSRVPIQFWDYVLARAGFGAGAGRKVGKVLQLASGSGNFEDVHRSFVDEWWGVSPLSFQLDEEIWAAPSGHDELPASTRLAYADSQTYLPDDILTKVDRATMAVSLEGRSPLLDRAVAETAGRVPESMRVVSGRGKFVLRELAYRHLPVSLMDRPKSGFGIPVGTWLRGPLRDWAEELLSRQRLEQSGIYNADVIRARWKNHLAGRQANAPDLWHILMMMAWLERR